MRVEIQTDGAAGSGRGDHEDIGRVVELDAAGAGEDLGAALHAQRSRLRDVAVVAADGQPTTDGTGSEI